MVIKPKINADGTIEKLKARLVAKGYTQKEGIDYEETFALVAKLNTIRMLIALATKKHWIMHQLDVKFAFLNGELREEQNIKLQCEDGSKAADATLYRQLVGTLIYLTTTRPDLAYVVNVLSQFMSKPLESHWNVAKNVLRYLQGTVDYGIIYTDPFDVRLAGFADLDWAGNVDDRKSITGYAFSLGSRVITWSSKKQNIVSLS
eukprot:PITA_28223